MDTDKLKKEQFVKMIESGDVDDTAEFWESVYDSIALQREKEVVEGIERWVNSFEYEVEKGVYEQDLIYKKDLLSYLSTINNKDSK